MLYIKQIEDINGKKVSISRGPLFDGQNFSSKNINLESNKNLENGENPVLKWYSTTQKIDVFTLLLFMSMYITFNIVYFAHYM